MQEEQMKRLLLVEDEETLRSTLRMNFELEGYDVTTAVRGSEALERIPVRLVEHGQLGVIGAANWYLGQREDV